MECLKCGRETEETFCTHCREEMKRHPVKPGVAIHLPPKRTEASKKAGHRKKELTPEEQVARLKKRIRSLWHTILVLYLVIALLVGGVVFLYRRGRVRPVGQNYSAVTQPTLEEEEAGE